MPLIVETGTGDAAAESYISVAAATARHVALGNDAWAALASDTIREQALRRATAYMEQAYRTRWIGRRLNRTQALSWPRWGVTVDCFYVDVASVPTAVANACADLALRASAGDLAADLARSVVREKVGPLETEYDRYSPQSARYRAIDMALAPFLKGSSAMAALVRT